MTAFLREYLNDSSNLMITIPGPIRVEPRLSSVHIKALDLFKSMVPRVSVPALDIKCPIYALVAGYKLCG